MNSINKSIYICGSYIELTTVCPYCNQENKHNITHASNNNNNIIVIDLTQMRTRICHNMKCGDYKL